NAVPAPSFMNPILFPATAGLLLALGASLAQAQPPAAPLPPSSPLQEGAAASARPMRFVEARERLLESSDRLGASRAAVEAKRLQGEGVRRLGGPSVSVGAVAYAYDMNLNLDLSALNQRIGQVGQALPAPLQGLVSALPL